LFGHRRIMHVSQMKRFMLLLAICVLYVLAAERIVTKVVVDPQCPFGSALCLATFDSATVGTTNNSVSGSYIRNFIGYTDWFAEWKVGGISLFMDAALDWSHWPYANLSASLGYGFMYFGGHVEYIAGHEQDMELQPFFINATEFAKNVYWTNWPVRSCDLKLSQNSSKSLYNVEVPLVMNALVGLLPVTNGFNFTFHIPNDTQTPITRWNIKVDISMSHFKRCSGLSGDVRLALPVNYHATRILTGGASKRGDLIMNFNDTVKATLKNGQQVEFIPRIIDGEKQTTTTVIGYNPFDGIPDSLFNVGTTSGIMPVVLEIETGVKYILFDVADIESFVYDPTLGWLLDVSGESESTDPSGTDLTVVSIVVPICVVVVVVVLLVVLFKVGPLRNVVMPFRRQTKSIRRHTDVPNGTASSAQSASTSH